MIKVIEHSDPSKFENIVNDLLADGFKIINSACGTINDKKYDYCSFYQAILEKQVSE